jgi:hypothetical protein
MVENPTSHEIVQCPASFYCSEVEGALAIADLSSELTSDIVVKIGYCNSVVFVMEAIESFWLK